MRIYDFIKRITPPLIKRLIRRMKKPVVVVAKKDLSPPKSSDLPTKVRIDASTHCQLKCPDCSGHGKNDPNRIIGKGYLKFSDFKNFLDSHTYIKSIELASFGELFLNPELVKILEYAHKKNVSLTANGGVNFNTASDEVIEALVKYKLKSMAIGIDGTSQEVYSVYRVGGNYDHVIANIRKLNAFKEKHGTELPKLTWQFVIMHHNENDVVSAKKLAGQLKMNIKFKLTWNQSYVPQNAEMLMQETGLTSLSRGEYQQKSSEQYLSKICHQLWKQPVINWDGRLLGCCVAAYKDFGVNVFMTGLETALSTDSFKYAKQLLQGKIQHDADDVIKFKNNIPCLDCRFYHNMHKHSAYVEIE